MPAAITPIIAWNDNARPLIINAKVDAILNPTDTILWEHEFVRQLTPDPYGNGYEVAWDGVNPGCNYGTQYLYDGLWQFTAMTGTVDAGDYRIEIINQANSELLGTLTAIGQPVEITIPPNEYVYIDMRQSGSQAVATVEFKRVAYWNTNGTPSIVSTAGNQLTVRCDNMPNPGVLTARAKVYDGNDFLVATSDDLTLTIADSSSGGGGS